MNMPRCPYCGGRRLAVDPVHGIVVCQDCGSVIKEVLLDDTSPPLSALEERPKRRMRRMYNKMSDLLLSIPPAPIVRKGKSLHQDLECIKKELSAAISELTLRSPHLISALAYVVGGISAGLSLSKSVSLARLKTGARKKTLYSLIRRYRSQIHEIAERVRRECKEELSTLLG